MDRTALQRVIDDALQGPQHVYGVFDPDRVPSLDIETFSDVQRVEVAVSPDCSYRLVRDALARAQSTLDVYIYNATADHMLQLLADAKQRGVAVRVMYDVMDTRGSERTKLRDLGVTLKEAPSSGRRQVFTVCHQKFAVIDQRSVVLGSANWAASAIPKATVPGKFRKGNREWLVHVDDARVASWFQGLFDADWDIPALEGPGGLLGLPESPELPVVTARAAAVTIPDEVFDVERPVLGGGATITPLLSPDNYFDAVHRLITQATQSIDIEQQYIVAGGPRTRDLLTALSDASGRGVELRIIVSPAFEENWRKTIDSLTAAGLIDHLKAINLDSFTHLHNKGVLVDGRYTVVTSTNMSENSITKAREAGVLIDSTAVAAYYRRAVDVDWSGGLDPDDVPAHLVALSDALERVEEPGIEIHPADARLI